jgi:MFS family permease
VTLLRRAPNFRWLFLATLGSGVGTMLAVVALVLDVQERTGSGAWISALLIADFLPTIAIGLLLGPLVDRISRRKLMIGADLVRLVCFAALPFASNAGQIVALALVIGIANGFFRPAVLAGLPNLVDEPDLPRANSILQSADNLTWLIGPLIGGAIAAASIDAAYWLNAATFLVSALLVAKIPAVALASEEALSQGHWRDLREGFSLVRTSRALLTVTIAWTLVMLANGAINVSEVFLVRETFDAGRFELGLLMAGAGAGLVAGSLVAGPLLEHRTTAEIYGAAIAFMAMGFAGAALSPNIWVALGFVVVSGFGNGGAGVCNPLLVQRGAPDRLRGRAFTVVMSINFAFLGLGVAVAGPLVDAFGARTMWLLGAAFCAVAAGVGTWLARGIRPPEGHREEEPLLVAAGAVPVVRSGEHPGS